MFMSGQDEEDSKNIANPGTILILLKENKYAELPTLGLSTWQLKAQKWNSQFKMNYSDSAMKNLAIVEKLPGKGVQEIYSSGSVFGNEEV